MNIHFNQALAIHITSIDFINDINMTDNDINMTDNDTNMTEYTTCVGVCVCVCLINSV